MNDLSLERTQRAQTAAIPLVRLSEAPLGARGMIVEVRLDAAAQNHGVDQAELQRRLLEFGFVEGARNTAIMAVVSGVYYWRAKTEERHLMADPAYRAYAEWMDRNDLWAKLRGLIGRRSPALQPAE